MSEMIDPVKVKHVFNNEDKKTSTVVMEGGQRHILPIAEAAQLADVVAKQRKMIDRYEAQNPGVKV